MPTVSVQHMVYTQGSPIMFFTTQYMDYFVLNIRPILCCNLFRSVEPSACDVIERNCGVNQRGTLVNTSIQHGGFVCSDPVSAICMRICHVLKNIRCILS